MISNLSESLLAKSVFLTKPAEDLATLDIYSKTDTNIVNKLVDIAAKHGLSLQNMTSLANTSFSNLPLVKKVINDVGTINKDNLVARISSISRVVGVNLPNLNQDIISGVVNSEYLAPIFSVVNNVRTQLDNVDLSSLKSVTESIQDITGNKELFKVEDLGALNAVYTSLITEASKMGIPNAFNAVVGSLVDPILKNSVIRDVIDVALGSSDIDMIKSLVQEDGSNLIFNSDNDVVNKIAAKYSGFNSNLPEGSESIQELLDQFYLINADWNSSSVFENGNDTNVLNVNTILNSSKDFKDSLIFNVKSNNEDSFDIDNSLMLLGTIFNSEPVTSRLVKDFPFTNLNSLFS